ncbi:MAG: FHA domain-containing protein [Rhodospirillaceae bacterium]
MAVLFADVTNSTGLYRKLGDAGAREIISLALDAMTDVLPTHGGRLVKTLGDAAMCLFAEAEGAVRAACAMQTVARNTHFAGHSLQFHIGLHCGPVILERGDAFGDTVNAAAYLTATATSEQILTTEAVLAQLSAELRAAVRPIFQTVLKGSTSESTVYQVLWRTDDVDLTTVNLHAGRLVRSDTGSLLVSYGSGRTRVDQLHPTLTLGRSTDCDIVIENIFASRRHAIIKLRHARFYLIDQSTNGTYVWMHGKETHVLRGELLLDDCGEISLGRRRGECAGDVLHFERDRRSMYRV